MKLLKKLAILGTAIALTFSVGALVSCGETENANGSSSEQPAEVSAYKFKVVKADGTAVSGVMVQLCKGVDFCAMPAMTAVDGTVSYEFPNETADTYDVHVWDAAMKNEYTLVSHVTTSANYNGEVITVTIAD